MSRLHVIAASASDVAAYFEAESPAALTVPEGDIKEGLTGLVIFEKGGRRLLRPVTWGFPRLTREMRERGEPPGRIGLVADLTNPMWEEMVVEDRKSTRLNSSH